MRRFRLTVEYDGTEFAGFQAQAEGFRTVQGTLEKAIAKMAGSESRVHGAGRTDAGVHATGQVIHFDTGWHVPAHRICWALNGELPNDVTVKNAEIVDGSFHARFSATARTYRYTILNRDDPSALMGRFAWYVHAPLDLEAMNAAAAELTGSHDFATFGLPDLPGNSTKRNVERIAVEKQGEILRITVRGNAFLRQQVRAFIGTLQLVGLGKISPADVARVRDARDRTQCPAVAPARGLTLMRVHYDGIRFTRPGVDGEFAAPDGTEKDNRKA